MKRSSMPKNAGFTIVEVLIAIALLGSVTALTWVSIANMFNTRDIIEVRSNRYQQVRVTMDRITSDIVSAYIAGPEFGGEEIPGEAAIVPDDAPSNFIEPVEFGMLAETDSMHFTTFSHERLQVDERASHHAEVGYFVRSERAEDPVTGEDRLFKRLMRREDTSVDDRLDRGGRIFTLVPDIESVKFEYWDAGSVDLGTFEEIADGRWVSSWDTTRREYGGRLPMRVRVTLELPPQPPNKVNEVFTTQVQIGATEVLDF